MATIVSSPSNVSTIRNGDFTSITVDIIQPNSSRSCGIPSHCASAGLLAIKQIRKWLCVRIRWEFHLRIYWRCWRFGREQIQQQQTGKLQAWRVPFAFFLPFSMSNRFVTVEDLFDLSRLSVWCFSLFNFICWSLACNRGRAYHWESVSSLYN